MIIRVLILLVCSTFRYRDEELELGEVVNFQIPVELDAGRRWLEAGRPLVSCDYLCLVVCDRKAGVLPRGGNQHGRWVCWMLMGRNKGNSGLV